MKPVLIPLYLSVFQYIIVQLVAGQSPPIYTPTDNITLNCGSSGHNVSDYDSRNWTGDINSKLSPIEVGRASQALKALPSSSSRGTVRHSQVPYPTARLSYSEFTYRFPVSPGQKFIRLYFYPASYSAEFSLSVSLFSVKVGVFTLLKDFNASANADADRSETVLKEFCTNVEREQQILNITFTPSKKAYAFINGIEIWSMPTNLYYSTANSLSSRNSYPVKNSTALQMLYRINVGGSIVSPKEDTGLYRTWDATDLLYLDDQSTRLSVLQQNRTVELKFIKIPEYIAPKVVYQTGRSMGMNKTINENYNLTWLFPVDSNFSYLIRLHFCEFESEITKSGNRTFIIYIANQTAEQGADIIQWSGGNGIPIYRDYILLMSDPGSQKRVNLSIALQVSPLDWLSTYTDALMNGIEIFKLFNPDGNNVPLKRNPPPEETPKQQTSHYKLTTQVQIIIAAVVSSILVFFVLGFLVIKQRWKAKDTDSSHRITRSTMIPESPLPSYLCRYFSLAEIKAATKNFNDTFIIGAGGFGNVYKGCIEGGVTPVAIKRLKPESSQGAHEFKTEIEMLSQLRHRHLVSLIGYCADKGEMILVYEYMSRGTLRDHLYHNNKPPLSWKQRLQICIGTARGLQYLHSGAKGTIIHRDVKSTNILLDDKWVAKVSDFGLSKGTTNMSKTHISTVVKGSFGYLDPEYYRRQRLTEKSDVYSLGVVLFEVLCARPAVMQAEELKQVSLAEWAKSCHQNGEIDQIIDPSLRGKIAAECLNKFTEIAISCMHDNGTERPSMTDVVRGLELALQLQQCAEGNINCTEGIVETEPSSNEQRLATNDSIKCISATIFSEINNPSGR
ncbi:receptor-like protein kinase FERONIA [Rosa rugosa]|uniref:receptor-like protein kinase FERONIA n=1 Tax=Rosa rugosa TaxID=74645 RepID=UPI002B40EBFE|nr:receptor-like protein kinase FERONIA [Rosa rugosa]